jgi:phospholipase C
VLDRSRIIPLLSAILFFASCGSKNESTTTAFGAQPTQKAQNIIVVTMQNASFDHLFGTFPGANGPKSGDPGYAQIGANGQAVTPFLLTDLAPPGLPEGPQAYSAAMNGGEMNRYASLNGNISMGYYDNTTPGMANLWSYAQKYAMADNYFSSVIGEAPSNELYMIAAMTTASLTPCSPRLAPASNRTPPLLRSSSPMSATR